MMDLASPELIQLNSHRDRMSPRPVLKLGLVGLPADWEARYAPALARLEGRVELAGLFDPTPDRADRVASAVSTTPFHGLRSLLDTRGLDGLMLLECGWQRTWALTRVASAGHPLFIGQDVLRSHSDWSELRQSVASTESIIVPECLLRYQPSTLRLRELMATQLGPVECVSFVLPRARTALDARLSVREVCNWFRTTFDATPVESADSNDTDARSEATVVLPCSTRSGRSIRFTLHSEPETLAVRDDRPGDAPPPFCTVSSESGLVELLGPRSLRYRIGGNQSAETLDADRSATDVALDLFARRARGGLLPVPDLADLDQAQRLAEVITHSDAPRGIPPC